MAQHDYSIANQSGASFRSDLNNALSAIVSQNSGTTEPSTTYAYQMWADTTNGVMKLRNAANSAWITLYQLDGEWSVIPFENGSAAAPSIYFKDSGTDTGFFSAGTDQVNVTTGGTERVEWGTSEVVFNDSGANYDFRVEGDTNANLLFVDASADAVGIGTSSPETSLHVSGITRVTSGADGGAYQLRYSGANASSRTWRLINDANVYGDLDIQQSTTQTGSTFASRLCINASGQVGIGSTSPQHILHLSSSSSSNYLRIDGSASRSYFGYETKGTVIYAQDQNGNASPLSFNIGGTEAGRFDTSSRLLLGTSTARSGFNEGSNTAAAQVEGVLNDSSAISIVQNYNADTIGAALILAKNNSQTIGTNVLVANGDRIGVVSFQANDGSKFVRAASIAANVDGTPGTNDMPGRLVFSTTADGASSPTERMRIRSNGEIQFGSGGGTNPSLGFYPDSAGGYFLKDTNSTNSRTHFYFQINGTTVGTITTSGSATAYNTSSDYRLKENVVPVADGITRLQQLKPSRFNFIADPDRTVDGFIAHEVQTVVPEAIHGTKDEVDADGNPIYQGIDQSKLVPLLTAALQEAVAKIESLEARLTAAGI